MSDRDRQSMGTRRDLTVTQPTRMTYSTSARFGNGWFGPLDPMAPTAPPETKGRILDFQSGYNLNQRPRAYEPITFDQLRAFADSYDLLRLVIETRKDQIAALTWTVGVRGNTNKRASPDEQQQKRIDAIKDFFLRPDKENFWDDWLRMILEDLFVLDAPAVYRQKTYGDELYALQPIDGATIKRLVDNWGRTPDAPLPAYQQVLKGLPAVDYTKEELLYRPRNKRTHKVYGYSPVEQIVMTINIALRRQAWQLQSFTEGNIPEALIGTPENWTPDQIRAFQDWFDQALEGNTAQRRKARFVPGGVAKGYVATKPDQLFGDAEEWLARMVCYAFSVSPQALLKMMNRATAETAQENAQLEGLAPIQKWVKGFMDTVLIEDFDGADLEFLWLEEDELDPDKKSQIIDREQAAGRLTFNEARKEQGRDTIEHPNADRPMILTATGWAPVFLTPEEEAEKKEAEKKAAEALAGKGPGGTAPGEEEDEGGEGTPAAEEDLDKADGAEVVKADTTPFGGVDGSYVDVERKLAARVQKRVRKGFAKQLKALGKSARKQVKDALSALGKADDEIDVDDILEGLTFEFSDDFAEDLAADTAEVFEDSALLALGQMGSVVNSELVEQVNERALIWARDSAAELVGINPDSPFSLPESTRSMLRSTIADGIENNLSAEDIADSLVQQYAFSEERAETIAMTEVASANSLGALDGYREAERMGIKVQKSWLILGDACDVCHGNAGAGKIGLDDAFPSGDLAPPAHPHCRCVIVPEVDD